MRALTSQFGPALALCLVALGITLVAAFILAARAGRRGDRTWPVAAKALAAGSAVVCILATALPQTWPPRFSGDGDLVLALGRGGLSEWRSIVSNPSSFEAVLLLTNVGLYVPFGALGVIAWPHRRLAVIGIGLLISFLVEVSHFTITERVASTDDFLLNASGVVAGGAIGSVLTFWGRARRAPPEKLE